MNGDPRRYRRSTTRGRADRPNREPRRLPAARTSHATYDTGEPVRGDPAVRLARVVRHALDLLDDRGGPLEAGAFRVVIEQLRHYAHETSDPAVRAAVHVACSHLSAGNLEDAHDALSTAAVLGPSAEPRPG